jgi:hypothetical protein
MAIEKECGFGSNVIIDFSRLSMSGMMTEAMLVPSLKEYDVIG